MMNEVFSKELDNIGLKESEFLISSTLLKSARQIMVDVGAIDIEQTRPFQVLYNSRFSETTVYLNALNFEQHLSGTTVMIVDQPKGVILGMFPFDIGWIGFRNDLLTIDTTRSLLKACEDSILEIFTLSVSLQERDQILKTMNMSLV